METVLVRERLDTRGSYRLTLAVYPLEHPWSRCLILD